MYSKYCTVAAKYRETVARAASLRQLRFLLIDVRRTILGANKIYSVIDALSNSNNRGRVTMSNLFKEAKVWLSRHQK